MKVGVSDWLIKGVETCMNGVSLPDEELQIQFDSLGTEFDAFSKQDLEELVHMFRGNFETQDLVYICSYFARFMPREELIQLLFSSMQAMDMEPWLAIMLKLQLDAHVNGHYEEKYQFNKKAVSLLENAIHPDLSFIPVGERNKERIVIITEQMLDLQHAPTKQVFEYAYAIKRMGYDVRLFSCVCDNDQIIHAWGSPLVMYPDERYNHIRWERTFRGETFTGYQINLTDDYLKEYSMMLDLIHAWNPLFVYALGVSNPIADLPNCFTDVVYHRFRVGMPPTVSRILVERGTDEIGVFNEESGRTIVRPPVPRVSYLKAKHLYERGTLGLPDDKFLIAIVGNRLHKEIDESFVRILNEIQERHDNVVFVLIGLHLDEIPYFENTDLNIVKLGYSEDLTGVMAVMDLYLNPFRLGGGYSGGIAVSAGVPVVTLPDCDVATNVSDTFAVKSKDEVVETVLRYIEDEKFRKKMQIKVKLFQNEHSEEKYFEDLKAEIQVLVQTVTEKEERL